MKRILAILTCALSLLSAYELGTDTWNRYTVFDPGERAMGMTYPASWLSPDPAFLVPEYEDSSSVSAAWEQILAYGGSGLSNLISVSYIPYSFPHRWDLGMDFISYKGPNPTQRTDVVFGYKHHKGSVRVYHTSNTQNLELNSGTTRHLINANAVSFSHTLAEKLQLKGGIDFQVIDQDSPSDDTLRSYNANHEHLQLSYGFSKTLAIYGKFEHRYFRNDSRENNMIVFRPGLKYVRGILAAHLAMRISPQRVFPIFQISIMPGPFFLEAYAKVRCPLFILNQPGYQYLGLRSGIDHKGSLNDIKAEAELSYDHTGIPVGSPVGPILPNFYMLNLSAEYRLKLKKLDLYLAGRHHDNFNRVHYFYHPEKSAAKAGLAFRGALADGKLLLDADINASYILHDDPDSVRFDPERLLYSVTPGASTIGNWKIGMSIKARIKTFSISLDMAMPLKTDESFFWHLYEGIYTSSDMITGNTFYAGLNISWLWWK